MKHDINLVIRKQKQRLEPLSAAGVAWLSVATVLLSVLVSAWGLWSVSGLRQENAGLDERYRQLTANYSQMKAVLDARPKNQELQQEVERLEYLLSVRHRVQELLQSGSFGNTAGYSDYFIALAQKRVSGLWITGVDIHGSSNDITMTGSVHEPDLVPLFMKRMSSSSVLAGTEFNVLRMARSEATVSGSAVVDFTLTTRAGDSESVKTVSIRNGTTVQR